MNARVSPDTVFRHSPAVLALAALLAWSACSSSPPKHRGDSLSTAAHESGKSATEKKKVLTVTPRDERAPSAVETGASLAASLVVDSSTVDSTAARPVEESKSPEADAPVIISILGGWGAVRTDNFNGFGAFGVGFGGFMLGLRTRADLSILYMPTQLNEKSPIVDELSNEDEVAIDVRVRHYFAPAHTVMSLCALLGGRAGWLEWDYHSPITVIDDNGDPKQVKSDRLTFYDGYVGIGVALYQSRRIIVGADLAVGLQTYANYTHEGFNQDLFDEWSSFTQFLGSVDYQF
ncbi:MAG TPA: hypothetical protein VFH88_01590 [Candidatus Krumholzibacteria bacterium]|nr:hypothetical protein [Candidatus Krumholzibacteria bacterium]